MRPETAPSPSGSTLSYNHAIHHAGDILKGAAQGNPAYQDTLLGRCSTNEGLVITDTCRICELPFVGISVRKGCDFELHHYGLGQEGLHRATQGETFTIHCPGHTNRQTGLH